MLNRQCYLPLLYILRNKIQAPLQAAEVDNVEIGGVSCERNFDILIAQFTVAKVVIRAGQKLVLFVFFKNFKLARNQANIWFIATFYHHGLGRTFPRNDRYPIVSVQDHLIGIEFAMKATSNLRIGVAVEAKHGEIRHVVVRVDLIDMVNLDRFAS